VFTPEENCHYEPRNAAGGSNVHTLACTASSLTPSDQLPLKHPSQHRNSLHTHLLSVSCGSSKVTCGMLACTVLTPPAAPSPISTLGCS